MNRRDSLLAMGTLLAGAALPLRAETLPPAAETSEVIYITPIRSDGAESRCQSEVWFARDGLSLYVVTAHDAWRAEAVRKGLTRARIWVGDVGVWKDSDGRYKTLPAVEATASFETDTLRHASILALMGRKYTQEWSTWGPRFRKGLEEGSRVMLRYRVA